MSTATNPNKQPDLPETTITRIINAPRELVFEAWTDAKHLSQWWGPHCFTNPVCEADTKPGGNIDIHMRAPDGTTYRMTGIFHEVVKPERLVFTSTPLDTEGRVMFEVLNTVTFAEHNGKTRLTVHAKTVKVTPQAAMYLQGMEQGWNQSLERLEQVVNALQ